MQAIIPVVVIGIEIEALATTLGITFAAALALYFGWTQAKTLEEKAAVANARENMDKDEGENHLPWNQLSSYRGKTKRGVTDRGNTYYYEKDYTHGDMEAYKKAGSKGIHIGSVPLTGGKVSKIAVPGRTIDL